MSRDCCVRGARKQCQRTDRQDVVIILGGKEVRRIPLFCFLDKLSGVIDPESSYESCISGLQILSGMAEAGRLDLNRFAEEGTVVIAQRLAGIFGGEIREFIFPSEEEGRKVIDIGSFRDELEGVNEDPENHLEEFDEQKEVTAS